MAEKSEKLTDEQIVSIINADFDDSIGAPGGEIAQERAKSYDYYMQELFGDEDDEVSEVVTPDVEEVVDGVMPTLLRMFTTADNLLAFDPVGPDDEERASQESDYVSFVFFKRNKSFEILYNAFWDALVQKTGIFKAWWDESKDVHTETYEGLSDEELYELAADEDLEIAEREERKDTIPGEDGEIEVTVHDVTFKRVRKRGSAKVDCIPPNEYRVSTDGEMEGHEREVTRGEMVAMGFPKELVWDLPSVGESSTTSPDDEARKSKTDDRPKSEGTPDKSQELILLREGYKKFDVEGNGLPELYQVYTSGDRLIQKEPFDRKPFHRICPAPIPHKQVGRSLADKTMDIQRVNSTILRQTLGNLYHTNNPGHNVWEQGIGDNTMDDLLTTKVGSINRFARPVSESYSPQVVPFVADASFPMLQYFDKQKRDRTGISSDSEGLRPEELKHVQKSVMAQSVDLSKMKVEMIARIFAETGLKSLFLHLHELILKHQSKSEIIRLRGKYVKVDPREWRQRYDMTVNIGLGISNREQNMIYLDGIWQKQREMVEAGGMNLTVKPNQIYNTAAEMVKNANYKRPEMFFTDPGEALAPPPSNEQQELEKMQAEIKMREQQLDQERQQVNAAKLQLQAQEQQLNHQREMIKVKEKMEEREDKYSAENEKLRTHLLELNHKIQQAESEGFLDEAKTAAQIREANARVRNLDAQSRAALKDDPVQGPDPIAQEKTQAEVERTRAQTEKEREAAEKLRAETEGQRIENRAAEEGINEMLEGDDGESEETQ